jgi:hypothetical protein
MTETLREMTRRARLEEMEEIEGTAEMNKLLIDWITVWQCAFLYEFSQIP